MITTSWAEANVHVTLRSYLLTDVTQCRNEWREWPRHPGDTTQHISQRQLQFQEAKREKELFPHLWHHKHIVLKRHIKFSQGAKHSALFFFFLNWHDCHTRAHADTRILKKNWNPSDVNRSSAGGCRVGRLFKNIGHRILTGSVLGWFRVAGISKQKPPKW